MTELSCVSLAKSCIIFFPAGSVGSTVTNATRIGHGLDAMATLSDGGAICLFAMLAGGEGIVDQRVQHEPTTDKHEGRLDYGGRSKVVLSKKQLRSDTHVCVNVSTI